MQGEKIKLEVDSEVIARAIIQQNHGPRFFCLNHRGDLRLDIDLAEGDKLRFRLDDKGKRTECILSVSEIFSMRERINSLVDTLVRIEGGGA